MKAYEVYSPTGTIREHEVLSFTCKSVMLPCGSRSRREALISHHARWFRLRKDAVRWALEQIDTKVANMKILLTALEVRAAGYRAWLSAEEGDSNGNQ